jgi:ketosteroid isomerase-like protein
MPTQDPDQFVRRMYDAFLSEGFETAAHRFFAPDIEYHDDPQWPDSGAHHGRDAVIARFLEVIEVLGVHSASVERVVDAGDEVAWIVQFAGRSPSTDAPNAHRWGYVGRLHEGRLAYFRAYYDPDEALATAGVAG